MQNVPHAAGLQKRLSLSLIAGGRIVVLAGILVVVAICVLIVVIAVGILVVLIILAAGIILIVGHFPSPHFCL